MRASATALSEIMIIEPTTSSKTRHKKLPTDKKQQQSKTTFEMTDRDLHQLPSKSRSRSKDKSNSRRIGDDEVSSSSAKRTTARTMLVKPLPPLPPPPPLQLNEYANQNPPLFRSLSAR